MPKPRRGVIPQNRLTPARKVRDQLRKTLGDRGRAFVTICSSGYAVHVKLLYGVKLEEPIPGSIDGVPIRVGRTISCSK